MALVSIHEGENFAQNTLEWCLWVRDGWIHWCPSSKGIEGDYDGNSMPFDYLQWNDV